MAYHSPQLIRTGNSVANTLTQLTELCGVVAPHSGGVDSVVQLHITNCILTFIRHCRMGQLAHQQTKKKRMWKDENSL